MTPSKAKAQHTASHQLPVVEHTLRECLSLSMAPQVGGETERLHDREVGLDGEHGRAWTLLLAKDLSSALVKYAIDTTDRILRTLNLG